MFELRAWEQSVVIGLFFGVGIFFHFLRNNCAT
jgi:hypothetical protein